ncbi:MAG: DUF6753 family protein [Pseudomonadota bacterium]
MSDAADSFARLLGRQASDRERQQLYRIRDELGIKNNDALWMVLVALQYHQTLFDKHPEIIRSYAGDILKDIRATADKAMAASAAEAKAALADAVAATAKDVARMTTLRMTVTQIGLLAIACCAAVGAYTILLHSKAFDAGYRSGYGSAYIQAKDEKAAAAWANTPQGKAAYRFAQAGDLDALVQCNRPGWYEEKGVCFVRPAPDRNIYGWRMK